MTIVVICEKKNAAEHGYQNNIYKVNTYSSMLGSLVGQVWLVEMNNY